ncbi:Cytochrome c [Planctomycetes bacterium Pan216]|uniref:Cytochrome c n=1 Tax=Kolteria novifilia TaxID=2527975 RepID=A0A518AX87_9BACT|nr:Cytochrome c [Planctomycetes bacterium Pan216]
MIRMRRLLDLETPRRWAVGLGCLLMALAVVNVSIGRRSLAAEKAPANAAKKPAPKKKKKAPPVPPKLSDVKAPEDFEVTLFAVPPKVNYPTCLSAAPTGELFVGVDPQGSIGKESNQGKVLRCLDTDGDGKADAINEFCKADHPRGLIYDAGRLWVLHPPMLTLFHDDDLDGVADRQEVLLENISTDYVKKRGADHTTNGIRMGIDGWIYIAVGDFGMIDAKGVDGETISHRGGGVLRVRPDGREMEFVCIGLRNIMDVAIDPYLNLFTRDNTNDGGGWDIRVSHLLPSANYGYPSLYLNFPEETMPPLGMFGGGSGCGVLHLDEPSWPSEYGQATYTCDWGRQQIFRHRFPKNQATFDADQETFVKIPRPTDLDVDGSGRLYLASWKNGMFVYQGPEVGFVARVVPKGHQPRPFPNLKELSDKQLVELLADPSGVARLHAQQEILRRNPTTASIRAIEKLAADSHAPLAGRVAAIFTLKQWRGRDAHPYLLQLIEDDKVREFALKALADRKSQLGEVPLEPFLAGLSDSDPRVQAQAIIGLGRIGDPKAVPDLLPLTQRREDLPAPTGEPLHAQPDPGRTLPHLAVQAIIATGGVTECLAALDGPYADGALQALRKMHTTEAVEGLIKRLPTTTDPAQREALLVTLIRLYHREAPYKEGWWGTRPDTRGPYFQAVTWEGSEPIAAAIKEALQADERLAGKAETELARHRVAIEGLAAKATQPKETEEVMTVTVPKADPSNPNQIGNLEYAAIVKRFGQAKGDVNRGAALFKSQTCRACHSVVNGQKAIGPHLVDIGKRSKTPELLESILKPSERIAQGFDTYAFVLQDGEVINGFIVRESSDTVEIRQGNGKGRVLPLAYIDERVRQKTSTMPKGMVDNLTPEQLADLVAYLKSLH